MDSEQNGVRQRNTQAEDKLQKLIDRCKNEDADDESENDSKKARLRRTNSVCGPEVISAEDSKKRRYQPDKPIHKPRDSLLSWSSGFDRYEGIVNWGFLILAIGGCRLMLENVLKYGVRVNPLDWLRWVQEEHQRENYYNTPLWLLGSNLHYLYAYKVEKFLAKDVLPSWLGWYLHAFQLLVIVLTPMVVFNAFPNAFSLLGRMVICTVHTIMLLKLWSYVQVNHWCRDDRNDKRKNLRGRSHSFRNLGAEKVMADADEYLTSGASSERLVRYPDNLTLRDLYYFLLAPTLCYELNFPRTSRIRKWFLFRRALEVLVLSNLVMALFQQWMIPSVKNSFKPFSDMDFIRTWERLLKLSIPNHLLWLTCFYIVFHSFLNTTGEILRFADRHFYDDWWNAEDVGTFWRLWNLPVHKWAVRHLFVPVMKYSHNKFFASLLVFLFSALLHEYLVSVPLQMYKIHVFIGMVLQVPLITVSQTVARTLGCRWGNIIVWSSLILGQPLGILVYFHDYAVKNFDIASLNS
ncbi:diacylglycerol O-acyltransferase 1 [Hyalella azteca]|uniref:O-acyltransferase n=1 Tax=Hyalella azteca TaxID=294128 RepID=A0A8B7PCJ2_HYAAZ|nr:diacylglycerol O-acyltransferase 1 [Hyalella azteca]